MGLVERDLIMLREIDRWRYALSRQIRWLSGFASQRTCDRRLHLLIDQNYLDRKHVLYGIPALYFVTRKGKLLIYSSTKPDKIKVDQIIHDIAVVDTAIYFHLKLGISFESIITEKELHKRDGFGIRQHQPDFIFTIENKTYSVEVELTPKSKERMIKNLHSNFMTYDYQEWIVPNAAVKIRRILQDNSITIPNLEILSLEEITEFVKRLGVKP